MMAAALYILLIPAAGGKMFRGVAGEGRNGGGVTACSTKFGFL